VRAEGTGARVEVVPDYERKLERVLIAVPSAARIESDALLEAFFRDLFAGLPRYTRLDVLVLKEALPRAERLLSGVRAGREVTLHVCRPGASGPTGPDPWAQNLGEAIRVDGKEVFLIPMDVHPKVDPRQSGIQKERNRIVREAFGEERVRQADFFFQGGNLAFDRGEKGLRVFVGFDDIAITCRNHAAAGKEISLEAAARLVSSGFGGAEVVVMGTKPQSKSFFHIDHSFVLLGGGRAVCSQIRPPARTRGDRHAEDIAVHEYYREQLRRLGYGTVDIVHTVSDVLAARSSANAIPFVDRESGRKRVFFPVFPGEAVKGSYAKTSLSESDLLGKAREAFRAYAGAGYEPIPVRDASHTKSGGIHCLLNVLE
jgi:hypothetical protein